MNAQIRADYDKFADVLYVAAGDRVPAKSIEGPFGLFFRRSLANDMPSGVTIDGYLENGWAESLIATSTLIGEFLHVSGSSIEQAIKRAAGIEKQ